MNHTQIKIITEGDKRFAEKVCPNCQSDFVKTAFALANTPVVYLGNKPNDTYPAELFEAVEQYSEEDGEGLIQWITYKPHSNFTPESDTRQAIADVNEVETVFDKCQRESAANNISDADYDIFEHGFISGYDTRQALTDKADVKEVETVEEAADKYRKSIYPKDPAPIGYYNESGFNGFIAGAQWQKEQSETEIKHLKAMVEKRNEIIKNLMDAAMALILQARSDEDGFTVVPNYVVKALADAVKNYPQDK